MMEYILHIILAHGAKWAEVAAQLRRMFLNRSHMGKEEKK